MGVIFAWLGRLWRIVRRSYAALIPLRITLLAIVLVAVAFGFSDQGQDAMRVVGETGTTLVHVSFALSVFVLALAAWYWSRQLLLIRKGGAPPPSRWICEWVPRILGTAVFLSMAAVTWKARLQYGHRAAPRALLVFALIFLAAGIAFPWLAYRRRDWLQLQSGQAVARLRDLPRVTQVMLIGASIFAVVFFVFATGWPQVLGLLGSPTIVILSAALWVIFGSLLVHAGNILRIPVLTTLVVVAFLFSRCNDNHVIAPLAARQTRLNVCDRFDAWQAQLKEKCKGLHEQHPVFIVVTEGGGIRAGYWTAAVLAALHDQHPQFSDHVFAISSVSGGSLGAVVYASLLAGESKPMRAEARKALMRDALAPAIAATLQPDLAQRFLPFPALPDRAEALEVAWEYGYNYREVAEKTMAERFGLTVAGKEPAEVTPKLSDGFLATFVRNDRLFPSLFLNGTWVETGDRAITSNVLIDNRFTRALDTLAAVGGDVKISTGSNLTSRFPFISPAATIRNPAFGQTANGKCEKCQPTCCHIVDGGYFENTGAATAAEVIAAIRPLAGNDKLVVIFIQTDREDGTYEAQERVGELTTPLTTLFNVRGARGNLAAGQLRALGDTETINFDLCSRATVLPLGWALAEQSRNVIDAYVGIPDGPNWKKVLRVQELLTGERMAILDTVARDAFEQLPGGVACKPDIVLTGEQCTARQTSVRCPND